VTTITINGVPVDVVMVTISYEEVEMLAGKGRLPFITYRFKDSGASGVLSPGDQIAANDGLAVTVESAGE
jgi:hypothetical protein